MPDPLHLTPDVLLKVRFYRGKSHGCRVRAEITFPAVLVLRPPSTREFPAAKGKISIATFGP